MFFLFLVRTSFLFFLPVIPRQDILEEMYRRLISKPAAAVLLEGFQESDVPAALPICAWPKAWPRCRGIVRRLEL